MITALEHGSNYLPTDTVEQTRTLLDRAGERIAISGNHTVIALAGTTGSGKSTLFNAFVGDLISEVGRLRPTTTTTTAAIWGNDPATELLDWLNIPNRHHVPPGTTTRINTPNLDGLILLDLPDFDSYRTEHREEVDRLLQLTDAFLWVTDPQKYADALIHTYLRRASDHTNISTVLLNQADRLTNEEQTACANDLQRLLHEDGLTNTHVLLTSTLTGQGLTELGHTVATTVATKTATRERLIGDLHRHARALREHVADIEPTLPENAPTNLIDALAKTAGTPTILDAVEQDYRRRATATTGWPPLRWRQKLTPDPLKRLRLDAHRHPGTTTAPPEEFNTLLNRTSLPAPTATAHAGVDLATRRLGETAITGLPRPWAYAIAAATHPAHDDLADALDQAILNVDLGQRRPAWWTIIGALQWAATIALATGLTWLLLLAGIGYLQLPAPASPTIGPIPLPTLLLATGALTTLLLTLLARTWTRIGAHRVRTRAEKRLHTAIDDVVRTRVITPVRDILTAHRTTRENLDKILAS
nr:GTPase [Dermatophilus congolensis]